MRRKYLYLCVFASLIVMALTMSAVHATGVGLNSNANQYNRVNSDDASLVPQHLRREILADASSVSKKPVKSIKNTGGIARGKKLIGAYNQLDDETERLLTDVLNLSSDFAILEEELNTPAKHQLLVLVTMKPSELFRLDYVELRIDNHTVAAYNYTSSDVRALTLGGGHRLYLALLPTGKHHLSATMAGRIPRDPDYNKTVEHSFESGHGRTVVELIVSSERSNSFPVLAVKEWNQ